MPRAVCPVCDADVRLKEDEAVLYHQVRCPECGSLLEVIEESPLELEEIFESTEGDIR
jgi:lysine biosynthesis protein LysW